MLKRLSLGLLVAGLVANAGLAGAAPRADVPKPAAAPAKAPKTPATPRAPKAAPAPKKAAEALPNKIVVKKVAPDASGFDLVGGHDGAVKELREAIELPLKRPDLFAATGIEPVQGFLLHGPPGTGKTQMARSVAESLGAKLFVINGPEVLSKWHGESEENLRNIFEEAGKHAPAVIFIDEIDAIAQNRDKGAHHEGTTVTQLLTLLDGVKKRQGVVVVAATNRPDALDPALRRPGRLEREIEIKAPDAQGRADILAIHTRKMPLANDVDIAELARRTEGLTGADLAAVTRSAGMSAIRREMARNPEGPKPALRATDATAASLAANWYFEKANFDTWHDDVVQRCEAHGLAAPSHHDFAVEVEKHFTATLPPKANVYWTADIAIARGKLMVTLNYDGKSATTTIPLAKKGGPVVTQADFLEIVGKAAPSTIREYRPEVPKVHFKDIAGLEEAKEKLKDAVMRPLTNPQGFARLGLRPPKGVLLFGPPGTGKTLLARAVATESKANFMSVKASDLVSKWHGESTKNVAELFKRARAAAPVVLFLDEIDALVPPRDGLGGGEIMDTRQVVTQFLQEMDGIESLKGVTIIAATNQPERIDAALRRPGRLDAQVFIGLPDQAARKQAFGVHTASMKLGKDVDLGKLAQATQGYSGADIENVCMKAGYLALREDPNATSVTMKQLLAALSDTRPSVTPEMNRHYEEIAKAHAR